MLARSQLSPRISCARSLIPIIVLILSLAFTIMSGHVYGASANLEISTGIIVPHDDWPYETIGPDFTVGMRKPINPYVDGLITLDVNHSTINHAGLIRTEANRSSGARRTIAQAALNLGTGFESNPNVYMGLGAYYAFYTDFDIYYVHETRTTPSHSETGLLLQAAFHFDFIETGLGNVFLTARLVKTAEFDYFPLTVGFRFK